MSVSNKTNCAGQQCPEREGCRRFEIRFPDAQWASFDLERQHFNTPCPVRISMTDDHVQVKRD